MDASRQDRERKERERIRGEIRDAIEAANLSPISRALGRILISSHYGEENAIARARLFPELWGTWKWTEKRTMTDRDLRQAKRDLFDAGIPVTGGDDGYFIIAGVKQGNDASVYLAAKGGDLMDQSARMKTYTDRFFGRQLAFV